MGRDVAPPAPYSGRGSSAAPIELTGPATGTKLLHACSVAWSPFFAACAQGSPDTVFFAALRFAFCSRRALDVPLCA